MKTPRLLLTFIVLINASVAEANNHLPNFTVSKFISPIKKVLKVENDTLVVIRFDYKQSAIFQSYTFLVLDSVVRMLNNNKRINLTIAGYAYPDEGSDTICYYLSLNRALFVQTYMLGRGIDSSRIIAVKGYGKTKPKYTRTDKDGLLINCRAELGLIYPPPVVEAIIQDRDEDGIVDSEDACPDEFGFFDNAGCPNKQAVVVPFEIYTASLNAKTFNILDSVILVLRENPDFKISIGGHAYKEEGANYTCNLLALERANMVKSYILSRNIPASKIIEVKGYGLSRPLNARKNNQEIMSNSRAEINFGDK